MIKPSKNAPPSASKAQRLSSRKKTIKKLIALISQHREQGLREFAADIPFLIVDEPAIADKSPDELVAELRTLSRKLDEDYELETFFTKYGSPGARGLRDKAKTKLTELGLDPEQ